MIAILVALGVGSFGLAAYSAVELGLFGESRFHGTTYDDAPAAPEFILTDHRGLPASLADYRGRAVLLFFGYTRCPDVCPLTLARLAQVLEGAQLGPEEVAVLLVSVDPEYDTPEQLAQYVSRFGPSTTGLTGDPALLNELFADYGVYASATLGHDGQPTLAHTTQVFGIDRAGRLRVLIHADAPPELIENDIRALVRAG